MDKTMLVYALSHPITGELRYIGKSESGLQRPRQHGQLSHLKKRTHLPVARWVAKLHSQGLDYQIEVVEEFPDRTSLMEGERFYIAYFRSLGFRLLNICDGGEGFTGRHRPESKEKIAQAIRGRQHSPEARERMVVAQAVVHENLEYRRKIAKTLGTKPFMDENGTVYFTHPEAARALGLSLASIRLVLNGERIKANGHVFTYVEKLAPGQLPCARRRRSKWDNR